MNKYCDGYYVRTISDRKLTITTPDKKLTITTPVKEL